MELQKKGKIELICLPITDDIEEIEVAEDDEAEAEAEASDTEST